MSEDPNRGLIRMGMPAAPGAGSAGRRRPSGPAAQRRGASRSDEAISYHPNEALAHIIVRAWSDDRFKNRLLTFPVDLQTPNYDNTRAALQEMGITIETKTPVVLTEQQYANFTSQDDQIVFVLPNLLGSVFSLAHAQLAMSITVRGM